MYRAIGPILTALSATCAMAQSLTLWPGRPAPPLEIKAWFRGAPVTKLHPKQTYVVEFWATWCVPCLEASPHLSDLAKRKPEITVLGVSVREKNLGRHLQDFVNKMGDKMAYSVGWSGEDAGMVRTWMAASGQHAIPCTFVVKDNVIQWIGAPDAVEEVLIRLQAGTWNAKEEGTAFRRSIEGAMRLRRTDAELQRIKRLHESRSHAQAHRLLTTFAKQHPEYLSQVDALEFDWLAAENPAKWQAAAKDRARDPSRYRTVLAYIGRQSVPKGNHKLALLALGLALDHAPKHSPSPFKYGAQLYFTMREWDHAEDMLKRLEETVPHMGESEQAAWRSSIESMRESIRKERG